MATPINQLTTEYYPLYFIVTNENGKTEKFPMQPAYLIAYINNDKHSMETNYKGPEKEIKDYLYSTIGELSFKVSVLLQNIEMDVPEFMKTFIEVKPWYNSDTVNMMLSICSTSKACLLGLLYLLYREEESLDNIYNELFKDVKPGTSTTGDYLIKYNFPSKLKSLLLGYVQTENPIDINDYIPTIEVEELEEDYPITNDIFKYWSVLGINRPNQYCNINSIRSTSVELVEVNHDENTMVIKDRAISEIVKADIDAGNITVNDTTGVMTITKWPTKTLFSINRATITNKSKNIAITIPSTFKYKLRFGIFNGRISDTYTLGKDVIIYPGQSYTLPSDGAYLIDEIIFVNNTMTLFKHIVQWYDYFNTYDSGTAKLHDNYTGKLEEVSVDIENPSFFGELSYNTSYSESKINNISKNYTITIPSGTTFKLQGTLHSSRNPIDLVLGRDYKWTSSEDQAIYNAISSGDKSYTPVSNYSGLYNQYYYYTHEITTIHDIVIKPGESISLLTTKYFDENTINSIKGSDEYLDTYYSKFTINVKCSTQIFDQLQFPQSSILPNANVEALFFSNDVEDIFDFDDKTNTITMVNKVTYYDPLENADVITDATFKLHAPFSFTDGEVTVDYMTVSELKASLHAMSRVKNMFYINNDGILYKEHNNGFEYNMEITGDTIPYAYNDKDTLELTVNHKLSGNIDTYTYGFSNFNIKIYPKGTTINQYNDNYNIDEAYDSLFDGTLVQDFKDNNYSILPYEKPNIALAQGLKMTFTNNEEFYNMIKAYITKDITNLTRNYQRQASHEENVLYHVKYLTLPIEFSVYTNVDNLREDNVDEQDKVLSDVRFVLNKSKKEFLFPSYNKSTNQIEYIEFETSDIKCYVNKFKTEVATVDKDGFVSTEYGGTVKKDNQYYAYDITGEINPVFNNNTIRINVSDLELYCYNGVIYKK